MPGDPRNPIGNLPRRPYPSGTSVAWISSSSTRGPKRQRAQVASPGTRGSHRGTCRSSRNADSRWSCTMVSPSCVPRATRGRAQVVRAMTQAARFRSSVPLGQQHPCQQRHHDRRRERHPVLMVAPFTRLPPALSIRPRGEEAVESAFGEPGKRLQGRTKSCSSPRASRFRKCKGFRLETWKGRGGAHAESCC